MQRLGTQGSGFYRTCEATFQLSEESRKAVNKKFRDPMTASGALEEVTDTPPSECHVAVTLGSSG
eukprot:1159806-Amphidinium_carterae.1